MTLSIRVLLTALLVAASIFTASAAGDPSSSNSVVVGIFAKNIAFNTSTITVPAGALVTVNFDNQDANVPHNVAFYETAAADKLIYRGEIFRGPKMMAYKFKAPDTPGTRFFRCDVHPTIMTGQFIVT